MVDIFKIYLFNRGSRQRRELNSALYKIKAGGGGGALTVKWNLQIA